MSREVVIVHNVIKFGYIWLDNDMWCVSIAYHKTAGSLRQLLWKSIVVQVRSGWQREYSFVVFFILMYGLFFMVHIVVSNYRYPREEVWRSDTADDSWIINIQITSHTRCSQTILNRYRVCMGVKANMYGGFSLVPCSPTLQTPTS